jgi:hypothetical protein
MEMPRKRPATKPALASLASEGRGKVFTRTMRTAQGAEMSFRNAGVSPNKAASNRPNLSQWFFEHGHAIGSAAYELT